MTATETMVDTWQPGEIRRSQLLLRLADDAVQQVESRVLILDVRPGADPSTIRVLWADIVRLLPRMEGAHIHEARWQLTDAGTGGPARGDRNLIRVHLGELVGQHEPRDPQANSLERLRDAAIATIHQREQWRAQHRPAGVAEAAVAARRADEEAEAARQHRDDLIRAALDADVSAIDLATMTGLRRERIYQIRNARRS